MANTLDDDLNIVSNSGLEIELLGDDMNIIQALDDEPNDVGGLTAGELKATFDKAGNLIKTYLNEKLVPAILAADATETDRAAAEAARQTAEQARNSAETDRELNESNRIEQENGRVAAEKARVEAEKARADETTGIVARASRSEDNAEAWAQGGYVSEEDADGMIQDTPVPGAKWYAEKAAACANGGSYDPDPTDGTAERTYTSGAKNMADKAKAFAEGGSYKEYVADTSAPGTYNLVTKTVALAESAKGYAQRAELAAIKQPIIQSGTWWVWDADSGAYTDTGVSAGGSGGGTSDQVFIAEYDVTTNADLLAAYQSGKVCFVKYGDQYVPVTIVQADYNSNFVLKGYIIIAESVPGVYVNEVNQTVIVSRYDTGWSIGNRALSIDDALSETSENPVQNKVVKSALDALSEKKVSLPKDADGNVTAGTAGWYAVSDGAGGITWVESAPSTGGGGSGETLDTSAKIAQYDMGLHTDGTENEAPGLCITEFYDIPNGYVGKITGLVASDGNTYSYNFQRLIYQDNTVKTYWSMKTLVADVGSDPVESGLYYASVWPANKVRFTLISATLDDSYIYFTDTGDIIFAGKNTPYYGMSNISDVNALSVAEAVDNEIAMQSLSTGGEVNTAAYSGLDEAYVSMVQSNYNAMMAEALGDYNKIPIIVHTDQHGRIGADNQVVKLIGDLTNWYEVSKCINLGDTVSDRFNTVELENYLSATKHTIPLSKRLDVYGNHDAMDADDAQKFSVSQARLSPYFKNIYAKRHGNLGYFTVNDDYFNVKYLVVTNIEWTDGIDIKTISSAQAKFIVDELSADDGRDIILVSHIPFDSNDVTSRDSTYLAYSGKFLSDTTAHNSFMTMIAARKNKTSGTFTDSEGVEHAYDFSSVSGNLLMSLHGHAHFEAYRSFENSITEFIFDMFAGNTFYFGYIDRENKTFKCWKNEIGVEALEISIA